MHSELKIKFKLNHPKLPKDYFSSFYSFFKQALEEKNEQKYKEFFGEKDTKVKKFCFYIQLMTPQFEKDCITLDSPYVTMVIRDCDQIELYEFYNAFLDELHIKKIFPMNLNQAHLVEVKLSYLKEINTNTLFIKMLSPIVAKKQIDKEKNKTWYYTYQEKEFINILKENIENTTKRLGYDFNFNTFNVIPINPKKTVISLYGINIPVSIGSYIIKAEKDLLTFLYTAGIGALRSSGCGAFEILGSE